MQTVQFDDVEVDRCSGCGGLWFDILEHEDLRNLKGSEELDTGDRISGRIMNEVRDIDCPSCGSRMLSMVALKQRDIEYEKCSHCSGIYFDAGELADFKKDKSWIESLLSAFTEGR